MHRLIALVVVLFATTPARADDDEYWTVFGSVPGRLGACDCENATLVTGLRPELVVAHVRAGHELFAEGLGIGAYGQVLKMGDASLLGAGLTGVFYGGGFAAATSVGVARFAEASHPALSFFIGGRGFLPSGFDTPIGVRVDVVFGSASLHAITFELDVIGLFALIGGVSAALPHG